MNLKKELICVFHPYVKPGDKRPYRYKVISALRLIDYIGEGWAEYVTKKLLEMIEKGEQKLTIKLRHKGTLYAYRK